VPRLAADAIRELEEELKVPLVKRRRKFQGFTEEVLGRLGIETG
jgi:DNA-binding transcriptional LysR family regulator